MVISVNHNTVCELHAQDYRQRYGGSSCLKIAPSGELYKKHKPAKHRELTVHENLPTKRTYKLNRSKVRARMTAMFNLNATKEFCAFYTISFPSGFSQSDASVVLNNWLTRCRTEQGLQDYVRVSEFQKNGTIHYHILVNTKMPIQVVNGYMRETLSKYIVKYNWTEQQISKYNGIDVDNVWYSKRHGKNNRKFKRSREDAARFLGKYISKYVSKGDAEFEHLAWHCSHALPKLFTREYFTEDECNPIMDVFRETKDRWHKFTKDCVTVYVPPDRCDFMPYLTLNQINEKVYALVKRGTIFA